MNRDNDILHKKFTRLYVIEKTNIKNKEGRILWKCLCDCENICYKTGHNLLSGRTKSCGCLHMETSKAQGFLNKKYNRYYLKKEYGIGYTNKNEEFYFDLEDYELIKKHCWYKHSGDYIRTCIENHNGKNIYIMMHQLISNKYYEGQMLDHKNGVPYDNRKENLRPVIQMDNMKNTKLYSNNKSGCKGVCINKYTNKWYAYITVNKHRIHLGTYEDINEAITVRKKAEEEYFGEYIRKNE